MKPPQRWGAERLWRELSPLLPGLAVEVVEHIGSTNTALLDRARAGSGLRAETVGGDSRPGALDSGSFGRRSADFQPTLLVAEHQTAGRGRMGRSWQGAAGASLTFSIALPLAPADWSGLSLAVGVALADALEPPVAGTAPRIALKWPNDLWLRDASGLGRKLGGVLIETVAAQQRRLAVIGIGINVSAMTVTDATTGFAHLSELEPDVDPPAVLARIARPLVETLLRFEQQGFAPFAERFAARDLLRGQAVRTSLSEAAEGVAEGVDPDGSLLVRTADGQLHRINGGEVSVRLHPGAAA